MLELVPAGLIVFACVYNTYRVGKDMRRQRAMAIERGVSPFVFSAFTFTSGLYYIPFVGAQALGPSFMQSLWFPVVLLISSVPGIALADTVYDRLDRGYDYQRKAAQKIQEEEWAGYFALFFGMVLWALFYFIPPPPPAPPAG